MDLNFWLVSVLRHSPLMWTVGWVAVLTAVVSSRRFTHGVCAHSFRPMDYLYDWMGNRPFSSTVILFALFSSVFWFLRIRNTQLGDTYMVELYALRYEIYLFGYAPMETLIRFWLNKLVWRYPWIDPPTLYAAQMCLYGGIFSVVTLRCCRKLPAVFRYLAPLLLLLSPAMLLYCGYLEVYPFPLLTETVYLLCALLFVYNRLSMGWLCVVFGVCLASAVWHLMFVPSFVFLVGLHVWRRCICWLDCAAIPLLTLLPVTTTLACYSFFENPFRAILEKLSRSGSMIHNHPYAQATGYTLFSWQHLIDFASELVFIAPAVLLVIVACIFRLWRRRFVCKDPAVYFLSLTAVMSLLFGFLYYPELGLPRDWDLYTHMYPPITLLGVLSMKNVWWFNHWRKLTVSVIVVAGFFTSVWILQNTMFWNYPTTLTRIGPYISWVLPHYYYGRLQDIFKHNHQHMTYWVADQALEESPGKYQEIMKMLDAWSVSIIAQQLPRADDYPGWARDLVIDPNNPNRAFVFDKFGRIFLHVNGQLQWLFAPEEMIPNPIIGALISDGSVLMVSEEGEIYRFELEPILNAEEKPVWQDIKPINTFIPEKIPHHAIPLKIIDVEKHPNNGQMCVLDNYNRVWNVESGDLLLQGRPSYNNAVAFRFDNYGYPVTIDRNNQLSYDAQKVRLQFNTAWFYPIVRDFVLNYENTGLLSLDLNGRVHTTGETVLYEVPPNTEVVIDRFVKITPNYAHSSYLVLDNRYRVFDVKPETSQTNVFNSIQTMINEGRIAQAYKHLTLYWKTSSKLTSTCYELTDTEFIRQVRGLKTVHQYESVPMFVDMFPINNGLVILLDRWGRLIYEYQGNTFLMDGTGLSTFPLAEVMDGTVSEDYLYFLCTDGKVWRYPLPLTLQDAGHAVERAPSLWCNLNEYDDEVGWMAVDCISSSGDVFVLSRSGDVLHLDESARSIERIKMTEKENNTQYMTCVRDGDSYAVAFAPPDGPVYVYTHKNRQTRELTDIVFDWDAIASLIFEDINQPYVFDRFGRLHPSNPQLTFRDQPITDHADALSLKLYPSGNKAVWMRTNGASQVLLRK